MPYRTPTFTQPKFKWVIEAKDDSLLSPGLRKLLLFCNAYAAAYNAYAAHAGTGGAVTLHTISATCWAMCFALNLVRFYRVVRVEVKQP